MNFTSMPNSMIAFPNAACYSVYVLKRYIQNSLYNKHSAQHYRRFIMSSKKSISTITVGFMLFALFFGAGNLIFPPLLGQASGDHLLFANLGFIFTGVGLPVLAVLALAVSGKSNLQSLASQVSPPVYGLIFTIVLYLTIGPLFALPRTNTVAYEIGIAPFFKNFSSNWTLLIFTVLFFGLTLYFSLQAKN